MEEQISELLTDIVYLKQDLNESNKRIDDLKIVVGTLVSWLVQELGHENVKQLVGEIDDI